MADRSHAVVVRKPTSGKNPVKTRSRFLAFVVALAAFLWPDTASAQLRCGERQPRGRDPGMPLMGLQVGSPMTASLYMGPADDMGSGPSCYDLLAYPVELGVGGGSFSVAYVRVIRNPRRLVAGLKLQATALRTWGWSLGAPEDGRWYAGPELQVARSVGVRVGAFRQLGGPQPRRDLLTVGLVTGF